MCLVHHSNQLNYVFKAFAPPLPHPSQLLPFLPHLRSPADSSGGCPPLWWQLRWDGVAHLCGGSSDGMGFSSRFQRHACSAAISVQCGSNGEPPRCFSQPPRPCGLAVIYGPVFLLSF